MKNHHPRSLVFFLHFLILGGVTLSLPKLSKHFGHGNYFNETPLEQALRTSIINPSKDRITKKVESTLELKLLKADYLPHYPACSNLQIRPIISLIKIQSRYKLSLARAPPLII